MLKIDIMADAMKNTAAAFLACMAIAMVLIGSAQAQNANSSSASAKAGSSNLVLNATSLTFNGYGYYNTESARVSYTVSLASGKAGATQVTVVNAASLVQNGIIVVDNGPYGKPDYSGIFTVQAANFTRPGNYTIVVAAAGADTSSNVTVALSVLPWMGNLNGTTMKGYLFNTSTTTATTIQYGAWPSSWVQPAITVLAVVAVIVVAYLLLRFRGRLRLEF